MKKRNNQIFFRKEDESLRRDTRIPRKVQREYKDMCKRMGIVYKPLRDKPEIFKGAENDLTMDIYFNNDLHGFKKEK